MTTQKGTVSEGVMIGDTPPRINDQRNLGCTDRISMSGGLDGRDNVAGLALSGAVGADVDRRCVVTRRVPLHIKP